MVPKPRLHRELLDPSLAPYMGQYFQQLRHLYDAGVRWFAKTVVTDTYRADLRIDGIHLHVRLWGGTSLSYEFFTSEHVSDTSFGSPGFETGTIFVAGSGVRAGFPAKGKSTASPRSSTAFVPGTAQSWVVRTADDLNVADLNFYTSHSWQDQKFFEHAWHPNNDGKSLVTSCQAQAPGLAGQCNWLSPYASTRIASAGSKVSDFGLDVKPTLYTKGGLQSGAPALDQEWIWWRRAAVQSAGGRQFFISTDSVGRFQVYPVADYSAMSGMVPPDKYKQYTPPYPSWVSVPAPTDSSRQVNDWLWRFNKDATKCVSIPYHSDFSNGYYKYLYNQQFFATLVPWLVPLVDPAYANGVVPAHEDTPGLVEFGIEIVVNSDAPMDFDVNFTLLRNSYFPDSGRFFFDAAYALPDVEAVGIAEDTLVTAEVACLYPAGYYAVDSGESPPHYLDLAANVWGTIVVNSNDTGLVATQLLAFPTFSGADGRFPTVASFGGAGSTNGPIAGTVQFSTGPATISSAGPVVYTPPNPPFIPGDYGGVQGYLYALELSTVSALYEVDDQVAGTGFVSAVVYGAEVYRDTFALGYTKPAPPWPAADTVMPSARWHQYLLDNTLNTEWGMGFSVHPKGHWALSVDAGLGADSPLAAALDWISVKERDGTRSRYTHKDLFNSAFGQTRDYSFYTEPFPGRMLWDQGSFRTQGIWVTFR